MSEENEVSELGELTKRTLNIFNCKIDGLSESVKKCVIENDIKKYAAFNKLVADLSVDWLQKIFQYYLANRKEKMQDYTPKSLAKLMGNIAIAQSDELIIDMCAGSGALTIQAWNIDHNLKFECWEFDETVIPILLFNLATRNIKAIVKHMDVLQNDVIAVYNVNPNGEFGKVVKIK